MTGCLFQPENKSSFSSTFRTHVGRIHRYFIDAGKKISVGDEEVPALDPLQLGDPETELVMDDVIPVSVSEDGEKKTENVRVRIVLVPEAPVRIPTLGSPLRTKAST